MEKNGRIILIDKELSEGQQKLSRYIEHYTGIPFTGGTYKEWQTWVDLNKPYADHEKAKENASRDETTVRPHKPHDKKRGREIACDAEILYKAIKSIGETNQHVCALCGFGHSYLSDVKRRGWLYESDIEKLAQVNIDPGDYVTDAWYRAKHELDVMDPVPEAPPADPDRDDPVSLKLQGKEYVVIEVSDELRGFAMFTRTSEQDIVEMAVRSYLDEALCMLDMLPEEVEA